MSDVSERVEDEDVQADGQIAAEPIVPAQTVLIYECRNPPQPKYRFMACFQRKAGGVSNRGMLVGHDLNWIGETAKEAEQQAADWWTRTFAPKQIERQVERGEIPKMNAEKPTSGRGGQMKGKVRMLHRKLMKRCAVDPSEVAALTAQGWERGLKF